MQSLVRSDRKHLWHPFTQQREWERGILEDPLVISRARGVYLYDARGRRYLDGVSSLWANLHGHRRPELDAALKRQAGRVSHSTFLGLTHEPGIRLAEDLIRIAPRGLSRVFYSDNGSTAVEVALKMAFQYHLQKPPRPEARPEFFALKNAYHGDTIGAVSVGGIALFHAKFKPLLFKTHFAEPPHCALCPYNRKKEGAGRNFFYEYRGENPKPGDPRPETQCAWECLGAVESVLKRRRGRIAAAILEPILQGAGGMIVMPPGYLKGFASLCKNYGVPWIADEVATGFGRTGKMFACDQEGVSPDILCLSKGISGGYLPIAATLATEKIYRTFLGRYEEFKTLFHGHTYTGNPLACAVCRASIRIQKARGYFGKLRKKIVYFRKGLESLRRLPGIGEIRQAGLVAGIEIREDPARGKPFPITARIGKRVCLAARRRGVFLRPLGDVIVLMPPLAIGEREIARLIRAVRESIRTVLREEGRA